MADSAAFETIRVTPVTPMVGAEIAGVDLKKPLTDAAVCEIHAALMAHGVVFFRDQPIDPAQTPGRGFARNAGADHRKRKVALPQTLPDEARKRLLRRQSIPGREAVAEKEDGFRLL